MSRPNSMTFAPVIIAGPCSVELRDGILEAARPVADGLLIEAHPDPERAWSDGRQSLEPAALAAVVREVERLAAAVGRSGVAPDRGEG